MICSVQIYLPGCGSIPTRCVLLNWAYIKLKRVEYLKKYYRYSLLLWAITPVVGVLYAIFSYNSLFDNVTHDENRHRRVVTQIYVMSFSLLFQTLMIPLVKREMAQLEGDGTSKNENNESSNNKEQIINTEFTLKVDSTEREANNENTVAEIETTCEKAKLTE